ncbi:hypothetical protein P8452_59814 [Trifolium repens]|nr:hypothetical protein P8452_59814 [Trifolium repens]
MVESKVGERKFWFLSSLLVPLSRSFLPLSILLLNLNLSRPISNHSEACSVWASSRAALPTWFGCFS